MSKKLRNELEQVRKLFKRMSRAVKRLHRITTTATRTLKAPEAVRTTMTARRTCQVEKTGQDAMSVDEQNESRDAEDGRDRRQSDGERVRYGGIRGQIDGATTRVPRVETGQLAGQGGEVSTSDTCTMSYPAPCTSPTNYPTRTHHVVAQDP